jgi:hypothetical protein
MNTPLTRRTLLRGPRGTIRGGPRMTTPWTGAFAKADGDRLIVVSI